MPRLFRELLSRWNCVSLMVHCLLILQIGCGSQSTSEDEPPAASSESPSMFREVAAEKRLVWQNHSDVSADFTMPEIMGSGCALLDIDGDDRLDALIMPGRPGMNESQPVPVFRQTSDGSFTDVTSKAGLTIEHYGMGVSVGDVHNDGHPDLLLTTSGGPKLFAGQDGIDFEDVTSKAGLTLQRWTSTSTIADFDQDGWLDLILVNYVDYYPGSVCEDGSGVRDYCGPLSFTGTSDRLYRNLGAEGRPGEFEDVTVSTGLSTKQGRGLGVLCTDLTGDHRPDIYVSNDMEPNFLWVQQPDGTFKEEAEQRGCATDWRGRPQASMGTICIDLDGDLSKDLLLSHLRGESNTLYRQVVPGIFQDETAKFGLGSSSLHYTGFGMYCGDLNLDGLRDVVVVNGRVKRSPMSDGTSASHWKNYAERNQIFLGTASGKLQDVPPDECLFSQDQFVSRGLAAGDIDLDGDTDLLVCHSDGPVQLFENTTASAGHWLQVRAVDPAHKRDAPGAIVTVSAGGRKWTRELQPNQGYQSSHSVWMHFGVGQHSEYDSIIVRWPDGDDRLEQFSGGATNQRIVLKRGKGMAASEEESKP